ncbi:MAG: small-conductance mechanosensitive channel [Lentimonas sp.]|jgi:small-conductance mechanosensitive channel
MTTRTMLIEHAKRLRRHFQTTYPLAMTLLENWNQLLLEDGSLQLHDTWQLVSMILLFAICSRVLGRKANAEAATHSSPLYWLKRNVCFLALWLVISCAAVICSLLEIETPIFHFFAILGSIWSVIGLLTSFIRVQFWAKSVAAVGYLASGCFCLAQIDGGAHLLRDLHFTVGSIEFSAWGILTGLIAFAFTLWISLAIARVIETQLQRVPRLSPSLQVLIAKIIRIAFIVAATAIAMSSMGINLSAFAVLGGAVGLGLGFGLQKVVSNFISGILLLLDNSIKPGDVIEIDGTYGWINHLRARYASVITRDGTEHLIPNEDLITQRVINWSFTNNLVRLKIPVGVSYNSDPHECVKLVIQAAESIERVLQDPPPVCHVLGFGDSSVDLELRIWISDPANGVANVKSKVLLNIWDIFKANDIEIPYPQRDLHIRSSEVPLSSVEQTDSEQS